jgi:hypothetical protein
MKKHLSMIAVSILAVFLLALTASAQTSGTPRLTATIPFEFHVRDQAWPAGEYTITCLNPASPNRVLRLSGKDGRTIVIQTTNAVVSAGDEARLIFRRYGDTYFLAQAWLPADETALAVRTSRMEKMMTQQLAAEQVRTTTVALNTRHR